MYMVYYSNKHIFLFTE